MNVHTNIDNVIWALMKDKGHEYIDTEDTVKIVKEVHDILVRDFSTTMCDTLIEKRLAQIREFRVMLIDLLKMPQVEQRSPEWHEMRKGRLTASDTATAIGRGKFETRKNLLKKKAFPELMPFISSYIMKWGTMFEEIANRSYRQRNGDIKIHEFGLVPHPTVPHFGASPDGISELGIMLELKCPIKRKIDGTIPEQYEIQMQGQMAVCCLTECDYVECGIDDFEDTEKYLTAIDPESKTDHGIVLEYSDNGVMSYDYSPEYLTPADAWVWAKECIKKETRHLVKITPWKIREYFTQRVFFDPKRWDDIMKEVSIFWKEVEEMKKIGSETYITEKQPSKRRERIIKVIEFIDDEAEHAEESCKVDNHTET
jgi:putative phage-type endonuclease